MEHRPSSSPSTSTSNPSFLDPLVPGLLGLASIVVSIVLIAMYPTLDTGMTILGIGVITHLFSQVHVRNSTHPAVVLGRDAVADMGTSARVAAAALGAVPFSVLLCGVSGLAGGPWYAGTPYLLMGVLIYTMRDLAIPSR